MRRYLVLGGICVLAVAVFAIRWPRLDGDAVTVTHCETGADEMVLEYRMARPFEVGLVHGIRKPYVWPDGPGIFVGQQPSLRRETASVIPSAYDWVRGEHYIRLSFRRGSALAVEANGQRLEFAPWSATDALGAKWHSIDAGTHLGDWIGEELVTLAESAGEQEYLLLYAGTDIGRWIE